MGGVQWDDANRDHIALHGITPKEVEEVLAYHPADLDHRYEQGESRYTYIGTTAHGRILVVVITERGSLLRPVTAFEPGPYLRKQFLRSRFCMKTNDLPVSDRIVPRFENELDEAEWWYEHRDMLEQDMIAALAEGKQAVRYSLAPAPTNIITLNAADEQAARRAAEKCGETYEMFVRRVVHEALQLDQSA